jgi:hypothetical protein
MKAHPVVKEAQLGVMEAYRGVMKAHPGAKEAHTGVTDTTFKNPDVCLQTKKKSNNLETVCPRTADY